MFIWIKMNFKHDIITKEQSLNTYKYADCLVGITNQPLMSGCLSTVLFLSMFLSWQNQPPRRSVERFENLNARDWVSHCLGPSQGTVTWKPRTKLSISLIYNRWTCFVCVQNGSKIPKCEADMGLCCSPECLWVAMASNFLVVKNLPKYLDTFLKEDFCFWDKISR